MSNVNTIPTKVLTFPRRVELRVVSGSEIGSYIKDRRKSVLEEQYATGKSLRVMTYGREEVYDRDKSSDIYGSSKVVAGGEHSREDLRGPAQTNPYISQRISGITNWDYLSKWYVF